MSILSSEWAAETPEEMVRVEEVCVVWAEGGN